MNLIYTDGASKGNPGPASIGVICYQDETKKHTLFKISKKIGTATNNIAEWTALISALESSIDLHLNDILLHLDSELVVKQFKGEYKTKNPELLQLKEKAIQLAKKIPNLKIQHIRRELNKEADKLANEAFLKN
jgi:ribonuclease HI